jgi:hypothetical protein
MVYREQTSPPNSLRLYHLHQLSSRDLLQYDWYEFFAVVLMRLGSADLSIPCGELHSVAGYYKNVHFILKLIYAVLTAPAVETRIVIGFGSIASVYFPWLSVYLDPYTDANADVPTFVRNSPAPPYSML